MSTFLKRIPIQYTGDLHDILLLNFTITMAEARAYLPPALEVLPYRGRALISMVDVRLRNMRPRGLPAVMGFTYRHIGLRLVCRPAAVPGGGAQPPGIYFIRSFSDRPLIVAGGALLTDYRLERARICGTPGFLDLSAKSGAIRYFTGEQSADVLSDSGAELRKLLGALDRSYAPGGRQVRSVRIQRERWPLETLQCRSFRCTMFRSVRFEAAFRVPEIIHYNWLPATEVC